MRSSYLCDCFCPVFEHSEDCFVWKALELSYSLATLFNTCKLAGHSCYWSTPCTVDFVELFIVSIQAFLHLCCICLFLSFSLMQDHNHSLHTTFSSCCCISSTWQSSLQMALSPALNQISHLIVALIYLDTIIPFKSIYIYLPGDPSRIASLCLFLVPGLLWFGYVSHPRRHIWGSDSPMFELDDPCSYSWV